LLDKHLLLQPVKSYQNLQNKPSDAKPLLLKQAFLQHILGLSDELKRSLQNMPEMLADDPAQWQALYYFLQGASAAKQGLYSQAEIYLRQAQVVSKPLDKALLWILATQELGYTQALKESFEQAFVTLHAAINRAQVSQDSFALAISEQALAATYSYADNFDLALSNYQNALKRYKTLAYPTYIGETLLGIATTLRHSERWDEALTAYEEYAAALRFQEQVGSHFYYHYGKAITLALSGRCSKALEAIDAAVKVGGPRDYLGELYKKSALCEMAEGNIEQAKISLTKAKQIIDNTPELQDTLWQVELILLASDIAKLEGDYSLALDLYRDYHNSFIQLQRKKSAESLVRIKAELENQRKDVEIELLSQRTQMQALELTANQAKQNSRLVVTIGIFILAFFLLVFVFLQHKKAKQLYKLSVKDALTGLFNRRYAIDLMNKYLGNNRERMQKWTVIMIDIDHFKQVNDTYGHVVGDELLKAMAQEAEKIVRPSDLVARFGGEEFICALTRVEPELAEHIAERLRKQLKMVTIEVSEQGVKKQLNCTASIGVAHVGNEHITLNGLLEKVDKALYKAKDKGRDCIVVAS